MTSRASLVASDVSWMTDAACIGQDDVFWPDHIDGQGLGGGRGCQFDPRPAIKVCRSCDVQQRCLAYALTNNEREGIWGGLTPEERRRMRPRSVAAMGRIA